jgi:hypothetical protein
MDWWSGAVHHGPVTIRRQVPLRELPLYLRENSLLVLGPVRQHVGEAAADPLTVEAFVTTRATFSLRTDAGQVEFRCLRQGKQATFEASQAGATFVLRLRDVEPPAEAWADGQPLPRLPLDRLDGTDRGWAADGRTTILKARARVVRME